MLSFEKSRKLHERAQKTLVGGVNSPVRSFRRVSVPPVLAERGLGSYIWDVDGNKYVDLVMSYGPHLFGHAHPKIIEAIKKAAEKSTCFGMTSEGELEWAELLLKKIPNAEKVRAMSSGTEACATAIRLARGITGRDLIVKFSGHYHGHVDSLLVDAGSGVATLSSEVKPDSKGIPQALVSLARIAEFNNSQSVEDIFAKDGAQIAAVILEPVMGNMGVVPPDASFLRKVRELCTQHGALLIFDEVMTGLRVAEFSAQGRYHIDPDLTTLGKIIGGGLPLAALCGKAKFMDSLAPLGPVYQAGTLSGNPLAIAAGTAMLKLIAVEDPYSELEELGRKLEGYFVEAAATYRVPIRTERVGSMMSVFFRDAPVKNAADCRDINDRQFQLFFKAMLQEGWMLPPSPFEAFFMGRCHKEVSADFVQKSLSDVFRQVAQG